MIFLQTFSAFIFSPLADVALCLEATSFETTETYGVEVSNIFGPTGEWLDAMLGVPLLVCSGAMRRSTDLHQLQ